MKYNNERVFFMEIDKNAILKKLEQMNNDDLERAVTEIAESIGINKIKAKNTVNDIEKLKSIIGTISDKDIKLIENYLGENKMRELNDKINKM